LDDALTEAFKGLGVQGTQSRSLDSEIENAIDGIRRGELGDPKDYLIGRFVAGKGGNYFAAVYDNRVAARDSLIKHIHESVLKKMDETQNLKYVETLLEKIRSSIERTLAYWQEAGVPENPNAWNEYVNIRVPRMFEHTNTFFLQPRETLLDRAGTLLRILKIFVLRQVLIELAPSLERGNLTTNDQKVLLPTIERVRGFRTKLQRAREDLGRRAEKVSGEVKDVKVPLYRVWNSGTFEGDLGGLVEAFKQQKSKIPSLKDVTTTSAWEFFCGKNDAELFESIKVGYQAKFRELLPQVNVTQVATENSAITLQYAERALSGLLPVSLKAADNQKGIPRFVLGPEKTQMENRVSRMGARGAGGFKEDHVREMPLLDHAVVFYEEKSQISPLDMLSVVNTMRHYFENPGHDASGRPVNDPQVWKSHRLAYDVERRDRRIRLTRLMRFAWDYGVLWEKQPTGRVLPVSARWPNDLPIPIPNPPSEELYFHYEQNGLPRSFRIAPDDPGAIASASKDPGHYEAFRQAIQAVLRKETLESLKKIYREEIIPRLREAGKSEEQINQITQEHFNDGKKNGLIDRLLAGNP
jgi:hypothetical protein